MNSWWVLALGFLAQGLFSARILVQWIMSEKAKKVVSPTIFWVISLVASYIFFIYGWLRQDFAIMLGQVISYYIYIWNIGQKGAWKKVPEFFRKLLLIILIFTPIAGIAFMVKDWQMVFETLLKNDNIPMGLVIFGSIGQIIFTFRFVYQWIYSS
ncbi:MAG: lipid-A-disaccharide synthase N-terminal domain-containing protein, partial [Bacteroidales bacterium]|nr:lipid-A-disaccharide synthase N-terminal domain-containing protein [Bacteroidales bacterium]